MIPVALKVVRILLVVLGIMVILDLIGVDITPMLAGMGIAGLAVFYLMVDRPFKIWG
ncbi:MAG: mechanosensitive ion channel family protein [Methanocellales archaeon]|nr:mechanosensitive ion channel family protein [Methanocellales archaeon]